MVQIFTPLRLVLALALCLGLSACGSVQMQPANRAGFCVRHFRGQPPLCSDDAWPSADLDAKAKRFESDPSHLIVYITRYNWSDAASNIRLGLADSPDHALLPKTMIRMRLPAGRHTLNLHWKGQSPALTIDGQAGEVRFIHVINSGWWNHREVAWHEVGADEGQALALKTRLIAEIE